MGVIPVRFKRVTAAFHEEARARLCESSGTEYSAQSFTDLSGLVDSFFEDQDGGLGGGDRRHDADDGEEGSAAEANCSDSEIKAALKKLFSWESGPDCDGDKVKRKIHALVVKALREDDENVDVSGTDFKRRLMARLRRRGLDAGLCKSKWEKHEHRPSGDYEYIDVVHASGVRYFVEVSVAKEFTIARPTNCYSSLLNMFPHIFVGKQEEVKKLTRLMCGAMKKSMKKMDIYVPPWRRLSYMQAKWFSSYKRTTNELAAAAPNFSSVHQQQQITLDDSAEDARRRKRSVGFAPAATVSFLCRDDFSSRGGGGGGGMRTGNLAAALNDNTIIS